MSIIYIRYRQLFANSYDNDKYTVTSIKLCRMGFGLFEGNTLHPDRWESSGSNDEQTKQTVDQA